MPHLAQLNLARLKAPKGSPITEEFFAAIGPINALAEVQPGFIWRAVGDVADHTDMEYFLDPYLLVNISVWRDLESLRHFIFNTGHLQYMKRRKEWFQPFEGPHSVAWWVPDGHIPSFAEAKEKMEKLGADGPTPEAFNFSTLYDSDGKKL